MVGDSEVGYSGIKYSNVSDSGIEYSISWQTSEASLAKGVVDCQPQNQYTVNT
jgi:hypothetical protein